MSSDSALITQVGPDTYRVEMRGSSHIVHVAGPDNDRWVHWNGHVFRRPFATTERTPASRSVMHHEAQPVAAPMPATVLKVLVTPGSTVKKHETLVILEAMKMELPVRASADGVVRAVLCNEGALVQAGATLVEFEP